jgi:hypothetical protein
MRCCIESITGENSASPAEGDTLQCRWCSSEMRFRDGAWEWAALPLLAPEVAS